MTDFLQILPVAALIWFFVAWHTNHRFQSFERHVDEQFNALNAQFEGLREYLYENDPQFDEERELLEGLHSDDSARMLDGMHLMELEKAKKEAALRTLKTRFWEGGFRSPREQRDKT